jgi:hypothetical protein
VGATEPIILEVCEDKTVYLKRGRLFLFTLNIFSVAFVLNNFSGKLRGEEYLQAAGF